MSHHPTRFHVTPAARLLLAAVLSGWIAGPLLAAEDEEVIEEEPAAAPAPKPAAKPASTPAADEKPAAQPGAEPEPAEEPVEEPAAAPAPAAKPADTAAAPAPAEPAPAAEADAAPAEEPADESGEAAAAEGDESLDVADEPPAAEPAAAAPAPEPVKPAAPATVAAPAAAEPAAEEEAEVEPEAAAATTVESKDESIEDAGVEAAAAPSAAAGPVLDAETLTAPLIAPEPVAMPVWNARAQEAAFTDFLRAGIPVDPVRGMTFDARVIGSADSFRTASVQTEQLFVSGQHARGKVFVVYRTKSGSRLARYVGLVSALRPAGETRTRAIVLRSTDVVQPGDGLVALDDARAEFTRERTRAIREASAGGEASGHVMCFSEGREIQAQPDDVLLVDRGSRDGITLAWVCEMPQEGSDRVAAYGRVVRIGPDSCLVRVLKSYEPVQTGLAARLASRPATDRARAGRGR